jgi:hypothetical protein
MPHYLNLDTMAVPEQLREQSAHIVRELLFKTHRYSGSAPAPFGCNRHDGGAETGAEIAFIRDSRSSRPRAGNDSRWIDTIIPIIQPDSVYGYRNTRRSNA